MRSITFCVSFLLSTLLLHLCLYYEVASGDQIIGSDRKALEITTGGYGGGYYPASPPPPEHCPPPPPPPPKPICTTLHRPHSSSSLTTAVLLPLRYPELMLSHTHHLQSTHCVPGCEVAAVAHQLQVFRTWTGYSWKGLFCDAHPDFNQQALAAVDFNGFKLGRKDGGSLPLYGFIDELPDITVFHANSNNFTGSVPKKVMTLKYFFELDLSNNKLSGQFPMEVLGATQLTFLDLRFNSLCGTVPPGVFNLDVDVIFINNNNFVQKLPDNLGSTPALYLTFANNKFTGQIPRSIGTGNTSENLIEVLFLNNHLSGCLPPEIGRLKRATVFDVSINWLTGPIPQSFQCLTKIALLNLAQNQFYGAIPEAICKLPDLSKFTLSYNYITEVGPECRKLIGKGILDVRMNCIIDLPNQRSKEECAKFFEKNEYHTCPNEKMYSHHIPCKNKHYSGSDHQPTVAATSPLSYDALTPHKL
ncbi:uncharacterized protein At4g06744-like [Juglans regia]|uniref:Uncharacterized protein At4g06744-like n=1 Tax=Juglans regia TaxID=51240 RepID=A0A6P9EH46_JUGRE|nr:uncharacterized protein At4g06744-like [Juglans regia]